MANWYKRFMELSVVISQWSKDANTKTGCVITDKDNRVVSLGYNGFPSGCDDSVKERFERPLKYKWTEHAERNAIYNAARLGISTAKSTIYIMWFPCADCARAIIQSGITKIICCEPDLNDARWGEDFKITLQMFKESGIDMIFYNPND